MSAADLKTTALNLAGIFEERVRRRTWSPDLTAKLLRDLVVEIERRGRALAHLAQRNHEPSIDCDGCLEVLAVLRSDRDVECVHGLALDMHCCECGHCPALSGGSHG